MPLTIQSQAISKLPCYLESMMIDRPIMALFQTIVTHFLIFECTRTNGKTHVDCFCSDRYVYSDCGNQIDTEEGDSQREYSYM